MWRPKICHEMNMACEAAGYGKTYNDYDYLLLHLLDDPQYSEWVQSLLIDRRREIFLDNSCFELGASLSNQRLADAYLAIRPERLFLPDVMGDGLNTRLRSAAFMEEHPEVPKHALIGVVQGENLDDLIDSYLFFDKAGVGMIAFPFMFPWASGSSMQKAEERVFVLRKLLAMGVINTSKPHHLLGTHHISEFQYYWDYDWVYSLDTSNPVMAAYEGDGHYPPLDKPRANLASVWHNAAVSEQILGRNCKVFREYCFGVNE